MIYIQVFLVVPVAVAQGKTRAPQRHPEVQVSRAKVTTAASVSVVGRAVAAVAAELVQPVRRVEQRAAVTVVPGGNQASPVAASSLPVVAVARATSSPAPKEPGA